MTTSRYDQSYIDKTARDGGIQYVQQGSATKSSDATVDLDNDGTTIFADASGGAITIKMPSAASGNKGIPVTVIKTDSSANNVTVGDSSQIEGGTKTLSSQYASSTVVSDGSNWFEISTT